MPIAVSKLSEERLTSRDGDQFEIAIGDRIAVGGAANPLTLSYYQTTGWHNTATAVPLNAWTHVTWRNSGAGPSDMSLFINGALAFSGVGVPGGLPGSGFMNIGTRHNNVEGFEGQMDDFRLYNTALSNGEIASLVPEPSAATLALLAASAVSRRVHPRGLQRLGQTGDSETRRVEMRDICRLDQIVDRHGGEAGDPGSPTALVRGVQVALARPRP